MYAIRSYYDLKRTSRIADLPAPLTLSYLSYARHLDTQTKKAHDLGHELMVHMPMEPNSKRFDPGPNALMINMNKDELGNNIDKMLASFTGYVGVVITSYSIHYTKLYDTW